MRDHRNTAGRNQVDTGDNAAWVLQELCPFENETEGDASASGEGDLSTKFTSSNQKERTHIGR